MILELTIISIVFLIVFFTYCLLPINKMKAVNKEIKNLLQVLPITKMINCINNRIDKTTSPHKSHKE